MEDILCYHIAPLDARVWRELACVSKLFNTRLAALEASMQTYSKTTHYTHGAITYTVTKHGIKHGKMSLTRTTNNSHVIGNYRLGLLHGNLQIYAETQRDINYYNGKLHGKYHVIWDNGNERILHYNHGILHGPHMWRSNFYGVGVRIDTCDYINGVIHGIEAANVVLGDTEYPYLVKSYDMGRAHGIHDRYHVNFDDPSNITSILVMRVEYEHGKIKHIHKASEGKHITKWIKKHNRVYKEYWNGNTMEFRGDATLHGYADGVVVCKSTHHAHPLKRTYESYGGNQCGYALNCRDDNKVSSLIHQRQFMVHGIHIIYYECGRAALTDYIVDGYQHGVCKLYDYNDDSDLVNIRYHNYLFDFSMGVKINA
ncbi:hypothetical protein F-VV10_0327 [Faustovirus]|nr:hypothetical protein F-VV10_0327 [Faustovirus]